MRSSYLGRLRERTAFLALKRQIVLGLAGGWLLLLLGGFRHLYVATAREATSFALIAAGATLFAVGLVRPQGLAVVERAIRAATGWIGKGILLAFLSLTYFLIITPVGVAWRALRGSDPFYAWTGEAPAVTQGWVPKSVVDDRRSASSEAAMRPLSSQLFVVIGYFVRNGHFVLVPVVVFLLLAGLVLFFVKSSALAPFIYTLF
ncbi:MAG: hypothetical protein H6Q91_3141 [Deltaproteobacteria bacterium]|nr:hypothetical protein [Deltaproteobacteria bacterium]